MIKPDGVQSGRFEKKGFSLKGLKLLTVDRSFAERHYSDLSAKPFFSGLVDYIISGPVVAMVWEVESARKEIALWFPEGPVSWSSSLHPWVYEN
ncbi:Nucleoside diphosphate kinase B [Linum perenne]